jgi:hypothetical protein
MGPAELLFANDAFYLAFNAGDADAMEALWAREHPIACVHPGWPLLLGREAVLDSFRRILGNPRQSPVEVYGARVLRGPALHAVLCYEKVGDTVLVASNAFAREGGRPRLVHHQAGPCAEPPDPGPADVPPLQ